MTRIEQLILMAMLLQSSASYDLICSMNGVFSGSSGTCSCHGPWKGANCSKLDMVPQPDDYVPAYGYHPNVTSWGGNAILGDDGKYHLFVSEIPGGLNKWHTHSQIIHAVADHPMATFKKVNTVLPPQAHNSAPLRAPANHSACPGCWYLFHIGSSNSSSGFAHRAASPYGPWEPVPPPFGCVNPAPAFANNGTLFIVCGTRQIYRAADPMNRTGWTHVASINTEGWSDGKYTKVEDAFLWQDVRGGWHLLAHRYDYRDDSSTLNRSIPVLVAGHAFSPDLRQWYLSHEPPFESFITFASGKVQHFATMERPHLIFDHGVPTHSIHAVSPIWDQYGAPCNVCDARPGSPHSCVCCKTTPGVDWTYTLVQKLGQESTASKLTALVV